MVRGDVGLVELPQVRLEVLQRLLALVAAVALPPVLLPPLRHDLVTRHPQSEWPRGVSTGAWGRGVSRGAWGRGVAGA